MNMPVEAMLMGKAAGVTPDENAIRLSRQRRGITAIKHEKQAARMPMAQQDDPLPRADQLGHLRRWNRPPQHDGAGQARIDGAQEVRAGVTVVKDQSSVLGRAVCWHVVASMQSSAK